MTSRTCEGVAVGLTMRVLASSRVVERYKRSYRGNREILQIARGESDNKAVNVDWKDDTGYITYT
jgi:hypothetical protein